MLNRPILTVDSLVKVFEPRGLMFGKNSLDSFTAINKVTFALQPGEIVGLLGSNGSGKTTIMQMLLGTLTPTAGRIEYFGKEFTAHRSEILQHIGFASSYLRLAPRLSIKENMDVFGRLYGLASSERQHAIEKFLKFFGVWDARHKEVASLSAGQTTRVMLAKAFFTSPKIALLDEPTASLDPDIAYDIRQFLLQQQQERGISILVASHNMEEVTQLCNRVLILKQGTIIANDTPTALIAQSAKSKIRLAIDHGIEHAVLYAQQHALPHVVQNSTISIEIEEKKVGPLLMNFARSNISYGNIVIEKPTLEDYFLHLSQNASLPSAYKEKIV